MTTIVGLQNKEHTLLFADTRMVEGTHYNDTCNKIIKVSEKIYLTLAGDGRFLSFFRNYIKYIVEIEEALNDGTKYKWKGMRNISDASCSTVNLESFFSIRDTIESGESKEDHEYFIHLFLDGFLEWMAQGKGDRGILHDDYTSIIFAMPGGLYNVTQDGTIMSRDMFACGSGRDYAYGYITGVLEESPKTLKEITRFISELSTDTLITMGINTIQVASLFDNGTCSDYTTAVIEN